MALRKTSRAFYFIKPICVTTKVSKGYTHFGSSLTIGICTQHLQIFEYAVHTNSTIIRDVSETILTFCSCHNNNSCCTT